MGRYLTNKIFNCNLTVFLKTEREFLKLWKKIRQFKHYIYQRDLTMFKKNLKLKLFKIY